MPIWMNVVITVLVCMGLGVAMGALVIIAIGGKSEEEMRERMDEESRKSKVISRKSAVGSHK